jgi:hypothetical protein
MMEPAEGGDAELNEWYQKQASHCSYLYTQTHMLD